MVLSEEDCPKYIYGADFNASEEHKNFIKEQKQRKYISTLGYDDWEIETIIKRAEKIQDERFSDNIIIS